MTQLSALSTLFSGTVLDTVKISNSEVANDHDTDGKVVECEEIFVSVLYSDNVTGFGKPVTCVQ